MIETFKELGYAVTYMNSDYIGFTYCGCNELCFANIIYDYTVDKIIKYDSMSGEVLAFTADELLACAELIKMTDINNYEENFRNENSVGK